MRTLAVMGLLALVGWGTALAAEGPGAPTSSPTAPTATPAAEMPISANAPVRIAGRVVKDTNRMFSRRLTVAVNGERWVVHSPDEIAAVDESGQPISVHELGEGDWIVAEGPRIGATRVKAYALRKLGEDESGYRQSAFYRPEFAGGYVVALPATADVRMQARMDLLGPSAMVAGERLEATAPHTLATPRTLAGTSIMERAPEVQMGPIRAWRLERGPGFEVWRTEIRGEVPRHYHRGETHILTVLSGRGILRIGDQEQAVGPGDHVTIPAGQVHSIRSTGDEPLVLSETASPALTTANMVWVDQPPVR